MTKKVITPDNESANLTVKLQKEVARLEKKVLSLENEILKTQNKYLKLAQRYIVLETESKKPKFADIHPVDLSKLRNPFFLDSESGFDWTLNPVFSGQCFQHFLPAVRVGIGCPVQSIFARILRIDSFAFMVMV